MTNFTVPLLKKGIDFFMLPNTFTDNWFWTGILVLQFIISMSIFSKYSKDKSILVSFGLCLVLASFLSFAGLIHPAVIGVLMLGTIVGMVISI